VNELPDQKFWWEKKLDKCIFITMEEQKFYRGSIFNLVADNF
jgi:hypothetical protein